MSAVKERTIHERIVDVIGDLPALGKTSRNEQQKFMYRSHDDVMNALTPLLAKHGVHVVPDVVERIVGERTTRNGGVMYEVNLHVRFRFYGTGGDYVEASGWGEGTDSGDKATNKAMTMAFKYVIAQVFALSTEESVDADATSPEETVRRTTPAAERGPEDFITPEQLAEVAGLVESLALLRRTSVASVNAALQRDNGPLTGLTPTAAEELLGKLRRWKTNLEASAGEKPAGDGPPAGGEQAESPADAPAEKSPFQAPKGERGSKAKAA